MSEAVGANSTEAKSETSRDRLRKFVRMDWLDCLFSLVFITFAAVSILSPHQSYVAQFFAVVVLTVGLVVIVCRDHLFEAAALACLALLYVGVLHARDIDDDPTVTCLAIAAIAISAIHLAGIDRTRKKIESSLKQLEELKNQISAAQTAIAGAKDEIVEARTHLSTSLDQHVRSILFEMSGGDWRRQMYSGSEGSYHKARRRIHAVVKFFDIDEQWFTEMEVDPNNIGFRPSMRLSQYIRLSEGTLFSSWVNACLEAKPKDAGDENVTKLSIRMVSECAMPNSPASGGSLPVFPNSRDAHSFIGLCWQLILARVTNDIFRREHAEGAPAGQVFDSWRLSRDFATLVVRINVGISPIWVHVVDDEVWQIFPGRKNEGAFGEEADQRVRSITAPYKDAMPLTDVMQVANSYSDLVEAAFGAGGRAQFYARSVLRVALTELAREHRGNTHLADRSNRQRLLQILGITSERPKQKIENPQPPHYPDTVKPLLYHAVKQPKAFSRLEADIEAGYEDVLAIYLAAATCPDFMRGGRIKYSRIEDVLYKTIYQLTDELSPI